MVRSNRLIDELLTFVYINNRAEAREDTMMIWLCRLLLDFGFVIPH